MRYAVTAIPSPASSTRVAAGLDGKAKAVPASGTELTGRLGGEISDAAPATRVADNGRTIVEGTR
jgi:hypothetical protein